MSPARRRRRLPRRDLAARGSRVALVVALVVAAAAVPSAPPARAEIENDTFVGGGVRMRLPRGWRISEARSYPGLLVWMNRTKPRGTLMLTVDKIDDAARARWPAACTGDDQLRFACALRARLEQARFTVSSLQGDRLPTFDYEDGHRWLRQGVFLAGDRAYTLVLAADSATDRGAHARAFENGLRSLRAVAFTPTAPVEGAPATSTSESATAGAAGEAANPTVDGDGGVEAAPGPDGGVAPAPAP